ncbi:MAG: RNA pyrophosphohydrolase [Rhodospirillales bacterium]|nr:RNA pyrophosphohydrolase [Alphaproteobacteria bacterium]USO03223.1 MAG: RNA pyrophosphohydrolase [Rhodospirillales bacterium]
MTLPYRPCVGIALFNSAGKVFVGERIDTPGAWQMPQGGIDAGEDIKLAALREIKEEIGTDKAEILRVLDKTIPYDLPPHLLGNLWDGKYKGQEQTWVAMRFTGIDNDIVLDADDHPEFSRWQWVGLEETLGLIVPFKRDTYLQIIEAFKDLACT